METWLFREVLPATVDGEAGIAADDLRSGIEGNMTEASCAASCIENARILEGGWVPLCFIVESIFGKCMTVETINLHCAEFFPLEVECLRVAFVRCKAWDGTGDGE